MNDIKKYENKISHYKPGDKIYHLFKHKKIIVKGNADVFLIKIKKLKIHK